MRDETAQIPTYVITYLFPLVILDHVTLIDGLVYAMFVALTLVLAARTSLVLVNPVLLLMNQRLFEVETRRGTRALLLSPDEPRVGQVIHAVPFAANGLKRIASGDQQ